MKSASLKKSYQQMIDWNLYRLAQNRQSLKKLSGLLPRLKADDHADPVFQADVDDLLSLKVIYETGIRNFEGKVQKYQQLLDALD